MTDLFAELGTLFGKRDRSLFLVGGSVRDKVLGRDPKDLDFTTDALPDEIKSIVSGWADAVWDTGNEFGTVPMQKGGETIEITTFRLDGPGRKPEVVFTDSLTEDLRRRDFTINAMAMKVDSLGLVDAVDEIIDPFGGVAALKMKVIDTPRDPADSFGDDPLRMLRAARFASQLGFTVSARVKLAMQGMADRIDGISAERITAEMDKLLISPTPERGLALLRQSGLLHRFIPELRGTFEWVMWGDDVETRWAELMFPVENPVGVEKRLLALKMSSAKTQRIVNLVAWGHKWRHVDWLGQPDVPLIRRVIALTGPQFFQLVKLLGASDTLLPLAAKVMLAEGTPEPFMSGKEIIVALGVKPGPIVGKAQRFLWELRLDKGPLPPAEVLKELKEWKEDAHV